jgi:hypothetical protein
VRGEQVAWAKNTWPRSSGAVESADYEPTVPGEDGIWFGDTGDLLKHSAAESLTDLRSGTHSGEGTFDSSAR